VNLIECFHDYRREFRAHAFRKMIERGNGFDELDEVAENDWKSSKSMKMIRRIRVVSQREDRMNCPICKNGSMTKGRTSVTFERKNATVVVKSVPANVCENCGEAFIEEVIARSVHRIVDTELKKGVEIEIIHYAA
jgi:YgiT-type zinc finger domain-containing protein